MSRTFTDLLVTGGAGFIGSHLARRAAREGMRVTVFDNLCRRGSAANLELLRRDGIGVRHVEGDIRDAGALAECVASMPRGTSALFHQASQVAVTTSVIDPRSDFEVNALGTFNVLEAVRAHDRSMPVIYASTNKVYGAMAGTGVALDAAAQEWRYTGLPHGVDEAQPLEFHSPYGCSKGAADQYVSDYARIYGIPTVVFRQSCIYGTHQFGVEDQGWIAWFVIAAELGRPLCIFGDGMQVRDVLWVEDLVEAYFGALARIDAVSGRTYNIGGGPQNRLTLRRLVAMIEARLGRTLEVGTGPWRPGDQRVFVADVRKAGAELGWAPRTPAADGIARLHDWVTANRPLLERILGEAEQSRAVDAARLATARST
jgi:CDP-paratose 2-epimerase